MIYSKHLILNSWKAFAHSVLLFWKKRTENFFFRYLIFHIQGVNVLELVMENGLGKSSSYSCSFLYYPFFFLSNFINFWIWLKMYWDWCGMKRSKQTKPVFTPRFLWAVFTCHTTIWILFLSRWSVWLPRGSWQNEGERGQSQVPTGKLSLTPVCYCYCTPHHWGIFTFCGKMVHVTDDCDWFLLIFR